MVAAARAGLCGTRELPSLREGGPVLGEPTALWPWGQKSEGGSSELRVKRNFSSRERGQVRGMSTPTTEAFKLEDCMVGMQRNQPGRRTKCL